MGTRQGDKNAGIEPFLASGVELVAHGFERPIPVCRCDVVGKTSEVHGFLRGHSATSLSLVNPAHCRGFERASGTSAFEAAARAMLGSVRAFVRRPGTRAVV